MICSKVVAIKRYRVRVLRTLVSSIWMHHSWDQNSLRVHRQRDKLDCSRAFCMTPQGEQSACEWYLCPCIQETSRPKVICSVFLDKDCCSKQGNWLWNQQHLHCICILKNHTEFQILYRLYRLPSALLHADFCRNLQQLWSPQERLYANFYECSYPTVPGKRNL